MSNNNNFDLETQFQNYLDKMGLKVTEMPLEQHQETKRAFFGAWGQFLVLLSNDVPELEEDEAVDQLKKMNEEVRRFWLLESHRHDKMMKKQKARDN